MTAAARRADGLQALIAPDGARILEFDERGSFLRSLGDTVLVSAVGVMPAAEGWVVVEREGRVLRFARDGRVIGSFSAPFRTATMASFRGGLVAARSPFAVATKPLIRGDSLLALLTLEGQQSISIGAVEATNEESAGFLVNSGTVAATDEAVFFAAFTRDEIRAYNRYKQLRWIADRGLSASTPTVNQSPSGPSLGFDAVNLGITANPTGVYVLSYADSSEKAVRLDRLDAETGVLTRTTEISGGPWLISMDENGTVWTAPYDTLLAIATPRARPSLPQIRLATISGDTFDLSALRGRVTLVNFWASWCPPCRLEFPLMNRLSRDLANEEFSIVAVNEDVSEVAARSFLKEMPANFVIPMGRGAMQSLVGYRGLPYTVLLDRQGRIIQRYFGFGGAAQFEKLRRQIDAALREK